MTNIPSALGAFLMIGMALCGWIFEQSDDAHGRGRSGERRVWDGFGLLVGIPVGLIGVIALLRYDFVGLF